MDLCAILVLWASNRNNGVNDQHSEHPDLKHSDLSISLGIYIHACLELGDSCSGTQQTINVDRIPNTPECSTPTPLGIAMARVTATQTPENERQAPYHRNSAEPTSSISTFISKLCITPEPNIYCHNSYNRIVCHENNSTLTETRSGRPIRPTLRWEMCTVDEHPSLDVVNPQEVTIGCPNYKHKLVQGQQSAASL